MSSSDSDSEDIIIASVAAVVISKVVKRKRKYNVNPYLKERHIKGRFVRDFDDMVNYTPAFEENFHMSVNNFNYLHTLLDYKLEPKYRSRPDSLSSKEKLSITLEFLSSGTMQRHIGSTYRVSKQNIGQVLDHTCDAIISTLGPLYSKQYKKADWISIANKFNQLWNLPNCLGAIDGKHVQIKCPPNAGSIFFCYKGHHSIILMAVSDPEYRFIYFDVGAYGSEGDSTVFQDCKFGKELFRGSLDLPESAPINGKEIPFFFIGDDAFPLTKRIMKPYVPQYKTEVLDDQKANFNYRLSRARRCVENAFGILVSRWRCLADSLNMHPDRVQKIVAACCILHNFLMKNGLDVYCPAGFADTLNANGDIEPGEWRKNVDLPASVATQAQGRPTDLAKSIRDHLNNYVNSPVGSLKFK